MATLLGTTAITGSTTTLDMTSEVSGTTTNDVEFILVESANQAISASGTGWAEIGTQVGVGTAADAIATRAALYWRRHNGSASTLSIGDAGNHVVAQKFTFRGLVTTGTPFEDVTRTTSSTTETTSLAGTGITTTGDDRMFAAFMVAGKPDTVSTTNFSGAAVTNGTSVLERVDNAFTSGNGGWLGLVTAEKATAGDVGPVSGTLATASVFEVIELALINAPPPPNPYTQTHFRIRSDDSQTLNADAGWAANLDTNATINAETVFRIRFEVEADSTGSAQTFKLQYNRNGSGYLDVDIESPGTATHRVDTVLSGQYTNEAATTNLLSGSSATFEAGVGLEADNATPSITLVSEHTEYEWALRIPISFGQTTVQHGRNNDGDTFQFRIVQTDNTPFEAYTNVPTVTLNIPAGQLGGTSAESPSRLGPWKDGNGNLYIFQEYTALSAWAILLKSTDGGDTWTACTTGGEPTTRDLESIDGQLVGNVLHLVSTLGTNNVYHQYAVSTHGTTPDQWIVKDQVIETPASAPTDQKISMVVRSDGTVVAAYRALTSNGVYYRVRSSGGTWGGATELDTEAVDFTDVWLQLGESDVTYMFYFDGTTNGILYYKTLSAADSLSGRTSVATGLDTGSSFEKPIFGTAYYDDGGVEVITVGYKAADDTIYTRQLRDGSLQTAQQVTTTAVLNHPAGQSSQQPTATLASDGTTLHCMYVDASTRDLWRDSNADGAGWGTDVEVLDARDIELVRAEVFTHSAGNGGQKVLGYMIDEAAGATGPLYYGEVALVNTQTKTHTTDALVLKTDSKTHTSDVLVAVPGTKTHTTDLLVAVPGTKTHTTDVWILKTGTQTHTTDVLVYVTDTKTHTSDVLVLKTGSQTHTSDVLVYVTGTSVHTTDVLVYVQSVKDHTTDVNVSTGVATDTKTHTTDVLVLKTDTKTHTTDVLVLKTGSQTHTTDLLAAVPGSQTHTSDVLVLKTDTKTHTTDVLVYQTLSQTHTTDVLVYVTGTLTHTSDVWILKTDTKTHTTDVYAAEATGWTAAVEATTEGGLQTLTKTHTTDALVYVTGTKTHTTDVLVYTTGTQSHTTDILVYVTGTQTHTTDVVILRTESQVHTTDVYVSARLTQSHTTDVPVLKTSTQTHTTDVYVLGAGVQTHTTDVVALRTETGEHTTDVLVQRTETQTHTTDVYVSLRLTQTHTTDLVVLKTGTSAHTTDVVVTGIKSHATDVYVSARLTTTHTTDSVVLRTETKAHTTDLFVLSAGTSVHTTDAVVLKTQTGTHTTDVLVYATGTKAHTTDLVVQAITARQHTTDVFVLKTQTLAHSTDVLIYRTLTSTHTSDVYVSARLTGTHTTDLFVSNRLSLAHTTDAVVRVTAGQTHTTDVLVVVPGLTRAHTTDLEVGLPYKISTHATDVYVYYTHPNWPQGYDADNWPQTDGVGWPQTHHSEEW